MPTTIQIPPAREVLTASRTYYVRTDGLDTNTGLANTAGDAFLTIQKAIDVVRTLDINQKGITILVADGTYNEAITIGSLFNGTGSLQGNPVTPGNCIIAGTGNVVACTSPGWFVGGFRFKAADNNASLLYISEAGNFFAGTLDFDCVGFTGCYAIEMQGGTMQNLFGFTHTYFGNFSRCMAVYYGSFYQSVGSNVISGSPTWNIECLTVNGASLMEVGFSGAATGKKYSIDSNSMVFGSASVPGTIAGTTATQGQAL